MKVFIRCGRQGARLADVQLDYAVPGAAVADYLTLFYRFRADLETFADTERADHAQIRFRLTPGGATYRFMDGEEQVAGDAHLIGPTTGAFHVTAPGPVLVFGAGVTPLGWNALMGNDASIMVNRVLNLSLLFGDAVADAIPRLRDATTLDAMVAVGETLFLRLVRVQGGREADFVQIVDRWLSDADSPELEALVAATGMSTRQIERKCNALYGAGPKRLARKYRALRAAVALVVDGASVDDLLARGFYDQSHLIREIKHFTGFTPGQIRAEPSILAQLTMGRRSALEGQVPRIVAAT